MNIEIIKNQLYETGKQIDELQKEYDKQFTQLRVLKNQPVHNQRMTQIQKVIDRLAENPDIGECDAITIVVYTHTKPDSTMHYWNQTPEYGIEYFDHILLRRVIK